ncbi:hypothetical protein [Opitutus terrae]|uniref:Uncharacterized protein n=1 Tax=Opitutus terrae (strain DSM 11246 / JCM 15787 / PB90-1) TaxID=452637 RepID=B1ZXJ2_OPITP|nr:hypothetical protein [Opitutus terrae]ACB76987.1 hypothetical protein Oter_3712 [Opitutus terrae PB90-1]
MVLDTTSLLRFLEPQVRDYGAEVELESGFWIVFAVPASDHSANEHARTLLQDAAFAHDCGLSSDDQWMLYYVDSANRARARHWLRDTVAISRGEIRPTAPEYQAWVAELAESPKPHRIARQLIDLHARGEVSAGVVRDARTVRACLDRLHQREPLFFHAFHSLLTHHLVDMVVLLQQLVAEDVILKNEIVAGSLSHDPWLQKRQDWAAGIHHTLVRFRVINPLDQQKNTVLGNPYAAYLDLHGIAGQLVLVVDGFTATVPRAHFLSAIHSIRRSLYRGEEFRELGTHAPWMTDSMAYPFRFIRQKLDSRRDLPPIDALYMFERALEE